MPANQSPHHGYLTEPRWFTARNPIRELTRVDTWSRLAIFAAVVVVIMIIAG